MKCINCEYHSELYGFHWCDIHKKSTRISRADAEKDVRCSKYDRKKIKEAECK